MHTFVLTFNAIISGTIAAAAAQVALAPQPKCEVAPGTSLAMLCDGLLVATEPSRANSDN